MRTVIVIPAYNEEKAIGSVLAQVKMARIRSAVVLVVDDGSTDNTSAVAKMAGVRVLKHQRNLGLGAALSTGLAAARMLNAEIVATFDADGQHRVKDLLSVLKPVKERKADIVIGSRLKSAGMPFDRWLVNWLANLFTWLLYGVWTTDSQSGLRAFSKKALSVMVLKTSHMEVSSEVFAEIARNRLRMVEVAIAPIYTPYSKAKGQKLSNSAAVAWKLFLRQLRV